jgi:hypothetical protein
MTWLRYILSLLPWLFVLAWWYWLYREKRLRVRIMAVGTFLATFLMLTIYSVMTAASMVEVDFAWGEILFNLVISTLFSLTVLAWWPILGRGLKKIDINW